MLSLFAKGVPKTKNPGKFPGFLQIFFIKAPKRGQMHQESLRLTP